MTVTNEEPSAPPLIENDEIPVVIATAVPTASATAFVSGASTAAPPPGMKTVTKTTTFPDGRKVTTTEYIPSAAAAPAAAPPASNAQYHPPRRDLGSRACSVACPYCKHTGLTRTNQQCGDCTRISLVLLVLFCFPLFWIPLVCPQCKDTEHFCRNCGKVVGWSRAECCNN
ncbi:hypothetical protein ACHAXM_004706 [Skeletonema potamos]